MNKQSVALALKGYSRRELPGWGWVLRSAGVFDDRVWRVAPTAVAEGKLHGYPHGARPAQLVRATDLFPRPLLRSADAAAGDAAAPAR